MNNENYSLPEGEEIGTGKSGTEIAMPTMMSLSADSAISTFASGLSGSETVLDSWNENFGLTFKWAITQDIDNNTSTASIDVYSYIGSNGQLAVSARTDNYITIDGTKTTKSASAVSKLYYGSSEDILIFSGSKTISHNSDGTLSDITVSASWNVAANIYNELTYTTAFKDYFTGSITITNIPTIDRYAEIATATDFTDETNPSLTMTNPGVYNMQAKIGVGTDYSFIVESISSKTATSHTFSLSDADRTRLREACPNANSMPVRITLDSINSSGTVLDSTYLDKTMTIVNANPTFSTFSCIDPSSVVGDENYLVQGKSNLRIVIDSGMVAQKGATGSYYEITVGSKTTQTVAYSTSTITADFGTIDTAGDFIVTIVAYDSRGNSVSVQKLFTINPYAAPTLVTSARRIDGFSEPSEIRCAGSISSLVVNGTEANYIGEVKYRTKIASGSYSDYVAFDYTVDKLSFLSELTELSLDKSEDWSIEFYVSDIYGGVTYTNTVSIENPILTASENAVAFGTPASADLASKGYNVQVEGAISISERSLLAGGGLNLNNGDLMGGGTLYLNSSSSSAKGIGFLKTGSTGTAPSDYNVLRVLDSKLYIDGSEFKSTIDPIDNLTSTSTTEPLSANMGRELNSKMNTYVTISDTRDVDDTPNDCYTLGTKRMFSEFKRIASIASSAIPLSGTYCTITTINPWSDSSGGLPFQMATNADGMAIRGATSTTAWGSWTKLGATYTLPNATTSVLGGVKVGTNLSVSSGTISVATATASVLGVMKVGTNLSVSSGTVSVATATTSALGVMKVGTGLSVSSGTVSVNYLLIYPVGAIYESSSSTSPASLFGGTWETYGAGRVTVASGYSDATYSAGGTGGSSTVTLTSSQIPSHRHSENSTNWVNVSGSGKVPTSSSGYGYYYAAAGDSTYYTGYTGSGSSHTNLQPYVVVYRWRRTA